MLPITRQGRLPAVRGKAGRASGWTQRAFRALFIIVPAFMLVAVAARSASIAQLVAKWHHEQSGATGSSPARPASGSGALTGSQPPGVQGGVGSAEGGANGNAVARSMAGGDPGSSGDDDGCLRDVEQWLAEEEERGRKRRDSPELNMTFFLHVPRTAGRCALTRPADPPQHLPQHEATSALDAQSGARQQPNL